MSLAYQHSNPQTIVDFILPIYRLKSLKRSGWVQVGLPVEEVESVAAHTSGVVLLVLLLQPLVPDLDSERMLQMAALHDVGEAVVGDLTPRDGLSPAEKSSRESLAVGDLLEPFSGGERLQLAWQEFEEGASPEAQFVRLADKLDMLLQTVIYRDNGIALDEFYQDMDALFAGTVLEEIYKNVKSAYSRRNTEE